MGVVKSGWLYHYDDGKLLKSWKLRYVILYSDDHFSIYRRPKDGSALTPLARINMKISCKQVVPGNLCYKWKSMQLPDGVLNIEALFNVRTKHLKRNKDFIFAAFRVSERKEWEEALNNAQGKVTHCDVFREALLKRNSKSS